MSGIPIEPAPLNDAVAASPVPSRANWALGAVSRSSAEFMSASPAAFIVLCSVEWLALGGALKFSVLLVLLSLCVALGVVQGACLDLIFRLLRPLPRWCQISAWSLAGLLVGGSLVRKLGAIERLHGIHHDLALQVILASAVAAVGFAVLAMAMQPTRLRPNGAALHSRPIVRTACCAGLLGAAAICAYADANYYVGLYPVAHTALRWAALWTLTFGLRVVSGMVPIARFAAKPLLATFALATVAFLALTNVFPESLSALDQRPFSSSAAATARTLLDFDHDGYAALLGSGDCNELNAAVNPGAQELPGNGIDDNCMLGDAARPPSPLAPPPPPSSDPSPVDVVLITVDALRPDHLGVYNPAYGAAGRNTSPNLDKWAQDATVFRSAYTAGGRTTVSIPAIMRGLFPRRLSWTPSYQSSRYRIFLTPKVKLLPSERFVEMYPLGYADPQPTLAWMLQRRGMHTMAIVDDGVTRLLTPGYGIDRGFDRYELLEAAAQFPRNDAGLVDLAVQRLAELDKSRSIFLWLHFFGIHGPSERHQDIPAYGQSQLDGYDHEIRFWDAQMPRLWSALESRGKPTIIALTSDHGEVFSKPHRSHGLDLRPAVIQVPLIIKAPGWPPLQVEQLASTVDLLPTLLALTHTPAPAARDGLDLTPWALGTMAPSPRQLISETWRFDPDATAAIDLTAAFDGHEHVVHNVLNNTFMSYDDPHSQAASARFVDIRQPDPLAEMLLRYADETGGRLKPQDRGPK